MERERGGRNEQNIATFAVLGRRGCRVAHEHGSILRLTYQNYFPLKNGLTPPSNSAFLFATIFSYLLFTDTKQKNLLTPSSDLGKVRVVVPFKFFLFLIKIFQFKV